MPLSIVIPVGPNDKAYVTLLEYLRKFPSGTELIFSGNVDKKTVLTNLVNYTCKFVDEKQGRAYQLNSGARLATSDWILFLHCDSRFEEDYVDQIVEKSNTTDAALYYARLRYYDAVFPVNLNAYGANFRSYVFKLPFGDQSFLVKKSSFDVLGGFDTATQDGEDHDFVWKLKQSGIPIKGLDVTLESSARKYFDKGWFKLSCLYFYLTWKKVFMEFFKKRR